MSEQATSNVRLAEDRDIPLGSQMVPDHRTRTIGIVDGYIPGIDFRLKGAVREGLIFRKAIVFDTLSYEIDDVFFDAQLLLEICRSLIKEFQPDAIQVKDHDRKHYSTFEDYCTQLFCVRLLTDREPFRRLLLSRDGKPVCLVKTEYYAGLPGPKPYEDSYTFSIYVGSAQDLALVERAIHGATLQLGVSVHHQVWGDETPGGYGLKRLFNWLFG